MSIREDHIKFLGFIVTILLIIISGITGWHTTILASLPNNYVRLERYNCDETKQQTTLQRIETKLDTLIMKRISGGTP